VTSSIELIKELNTAIWAEVEDLTMSSKDSKLELGSDTVTESSLILEGNF